MEHGYYKIPVFFEQSLDDISMVVRMRNFVCKGCKLEAMLIVTSDVCCPQCKTEDIEYD